MKTKKIVAVKLQVVVFLFVNGILLHIEFVPFLFVASLKCFGPPKTPTKCLAVENPLRCFTSVGLLPALPVVDGVQDLSAYEISD